MKGQHEQKEDEDKPVYVEVSVSANYCCMPH